MENYYEILEITPQASTVEITNAIGDHYNKVRRLINHHDPNIVNQANQVLVVLEQMKTVLLDPEKKSEYDLSISTVGGLADTSIPPAPPSDTEKHQHTPPIDNRFNENAWICSKCQKPNPKGALYCQYCSNAIGRICPICLTHYETSVLYCPSCGKSIEQAQAKSQLMQDLQKMQIEKRTISQKTIDNVYPEARYMDYLSAGSLGWGLLMGATSVLFILVTLFKIILSFISGSAYGSSGLATVISIISGLNSFLLWVVWAGVLGVFYYLIKKRGMKFSTPALAGYAVLSLFAMLFQGGSLLRQFYGGSTNHWLTFISLLAMVFIGLCGYFFSKNPVFIVPPDIKHPVYMKIESLIKQLFTQYDKSVWMVSGIGLAVALLVLIFSSSRALFVSLIAGILGIGVGLFLLVIAYRTNKTTELQKTRFVNLQESEAVKVTELDTQIDVIQKQINELG